MLFVMATILMVQLQSFHRLFLVCAVAPLAVIGVVTALLPSGAPLGFVAILGVLALIGILIRNSVILIVQIEEVRNEGRSAWEAVVEATEHRFRADHADRGSGKFWRSFRSKRFLGAGWPTRYDGGHHRRHPAHVVVLTGSVRDLVPGLGEPTGMQNPSMRPSASASEERPARTTPALKRRVPFQ